VRGRRSPSFKNVLVARELVEVVVTSQREYLFLYGFLLTLATPTFFIIFMISTNFLILQITALLLLILFRLLLMCVCIFCDSFIFPGLLPSIPLLGNVFRNHFGNDA